MRVEVRLYATMRKYGPPDGTPLLLELEAGTDLGRLMRSLGIPEEEPAVTLVNGRPGISETVLREGDRVVLFPPVAGG